MKINSEKNKLYVLKLKNFFKRKISYQRSNKYLFILSPPYCGSTLLTQLITTSSSVSVNNPFRSMEGQELPKVREIMFDIEDRWDLDLTFKWPFIKKEWLKYWDVTKPILLEKSPPNIIRVNDISKAFNPAFFIIFYRNPYALCESLIRRNGIEAIEAAQFAVKCLKIQKSNISQLEQKIQLSYNELTSSTEECVNKLVRFLPELKDVDHNRSFTAANYKSKKLKIQNLNSQKISFLSKRQIHEINEVFNNEISILKNFGYSIIDK